MIGKRANTVRPTSGNYNAVAEGLMDVLYTIRPVGDILMAMT